MKTHIVIHHSLTKDGETVSWDAIRRYHTLEKGWEAIGYHIGIELIGNRHEILFGRMPDQIGAHARSARMNHVGIGICCVGDYNKVEPSSGMMEQLERVIRWLMRTYQIPAENVIGHRDAGLMIGRDWQKGEFKSCPGIKFPLNEFKRGL